MLWLQMGNQTLSGAWGQVRQLETDNQLLRAKLEEREGEGGGGGRGREEESRGGPVSHTADYQEWDGVRRAEGGCGRGGSFKSIVSALNVCFF